MVTRSGAVSVLKVRLAGICRVVMSTPGRIEPQTEPTPGKFDAAPKLLWTEIGDPSRDGDSGAIRLPVSPKFGPVPPTKGNWTNGWLKAGLKSGEKLVSAVEPEVRSGAMMMAGALPSCVAPKKSCEFGSAKLDRCLGLLTLTPRYPSVL